MVRTTRLAMDVHKPLDRDEPTAAATKATKSTKNSWFISFQMGP
jgi:hypothetical protein